MTARLKGRRREAARLLEDLASWARQDTGVGALAVVGSYARGQERMASDLDVVVLTNHFEHVDLVNGWFQEVRPGSRLVRTAAWGPVREQRYRLSSGLLVEVGIASPGWAAVPLDAGTRRVLSDGHRVLHDPQGMLALAAASLHDGP